MFSRPKRPAHAIDMAPLIDVVFLLLVFFMLTSSFSQPSLPLDLPRAGGAEARPDDAIEISMNAAGEIAIGGERVTIDAFEETLRSHLAARGDTAVNFRGDRGMDYGRFVDLMDRARRTGATQFNLVHEPADGQ